MKYEYREVELYNTIITRFTNSTWRENSKWRENNNHKDGCIYNAVCPTPISVNNYTNLFVIEMNIETNDIIGIGLIKNKYCLKTIKVYSVSKYNYFTYKSDYRIDSSKFEEIFTDEELDLINLLKKFLFRGFSHLKRGSGYSKLPDKMIYKGGKNIKDEKIDNVYTQLFKIAFKRYYSKGLRNDINI